MTATAAAESLSAEPVVPVTKLRLPGTRPGLVSRGSLLRLLCDGRHARLTLVTGPAGAGKTTLLSQWHETTEEDRPFGWVSLDPEDADPARFWACVIHSLRNLHPGFGEPALGALRGGRGGLLDVVVPLVVNEAAELEQPTVLILDDLHAIGAADAVHRSLGFLLDHLPDTLQLAIATRTDPPLPTARLRARGQLVEVRARDLRFSDREAAALLERAFGLSLADADMARLQQRTEGWAAGLQLAGVSLERHGADFEAFIAAFDGDGREIVDYLCAEVIEALVPDLRRFLLRTAILDRLSAELCDAVTRERNASVCLDELERRNVLIVPLDPQRQWWRYHHLFADALRRELARAETPAAIAALHRRAAGWHRANGPATDAVRHALLSDDVDLAAELIADNWEATFNRGELATVQRWLERLPTGRVVRDPRLWLARLWTLMDSGRLVEAGRLLDEEEAAGSEMDAWGRLLHALHDFKVGDLEGATPEIAGAREASLDDSFWRTVAAMVEGLCAYWSEQSPRAGPSFAEAARLAAAHGNRLGHAYALGYLGLLATEAGDTDAAEARLAEIDALRGEDAGVGEHFVSFAATLTRARLDERAGAYEAAAAHLERGVALAARGAGALERAECLLSLALVQRTRGRREEGRGLVREAARLLDACPAPGRLAARRRSAERTLLGHAANEGAPGTVDALSESELAVLRLLPTTMSQREIGQQLYISVNTVKTHCRNIYAKLHVGSREQAVGRARELRLI